MSRIWKILVALSLTLNGVCLLYVYALSHPNPYGRQYYETEQIRQDLRQIREDLNEIKAARAATAPAN